MFEMVGEMRLLAGTTCTNGINSFASGSDIRPEIWDWPCTSWAVKRNTQRMNEEM